MRMTALEEYNQHRKNLKKKKTKIAKPKPHSQKHRNMFKIRSKE